MNVNPSFDLARGAKIGQVKIDAKNAVFVVGSQKIDVTTDEIEIIQRLMTMNSCSDQELVNQTFEMLIKKLDNIDIANYGGNGSYYEETIRVSDLFKVENGVCRFDRGLALLVGNEYLSDEQLWSIKFQPHDYKGFNF
jgi:hypothetical protein